MRGVLPKIGTLISREIDHLKHLEESTLSSDLSQGYALKMLTGLFTIRRYENSYMFWYFCVRFTSVLLVHRSHQAAVQGPDGWDGAEWIPLTEEVDKPAILFVAFVQPKPSSCLVYGLQVSGAEDQAGG